MHDKFTNSNKRISGMVRVLNVGTLLGLWAKGIGKGNCLGWSTCSLSREIGGQEGY